MTTRMIGLTADQTTATLLITRLGHPGDVMNMEIEVVDDEGTPVGRQPIESWHRTPIRSRPKGPDDELHWTKPTIRGLRPGRSYRVNLVDRRRFPRASATVTTAPDESVDRIRLATGSCFDINGKHTRVLDEAYRQLADGTEPVPTYNLWLGDQVYVDAPWLETTTTAKMRSIIFDRYLRTWGLQKTAQDRRTRASDLHPSMARTSNWFLPDDHEFWNGYPNPSWLTLFGHTARRFLRQVWRLPKPAPPHPAAQGKWGATAGEAYALFASPLDFDEFDEGYSPDQLQTFGTAEAVVVMVDTRWHRTIRKQGPGSGFMPKADFERLIDLLDDDDRLVCLGLSKPLIGHLPHRGLTRRKVEYGPEDYPGQYNALWRALNRRAGAGRPTMIVAGDVHHHAIRTAAGDGVLEVVSSPLSILEALDDDSELTKVRKRWVAIRGRLQRAWRSTKSWIRGREEALRPGLATTDDHLAYPRFVDGDAWETETGTLMFETDPGDFADPHRRQGREPSGLATVDLSSDSSGHTVTVHYVLGYVNDAGDVVTRREDRTFHWEKTDPNDPEARSAWRKQ